MQNFSIRRFLSEGNSRSALFLAAIATVLAGCGGGGGSDSTTTTTTTPTAVVVKAASVQLLATNSQIGSAGTTTLDLTAVVLDSNRQALAGRTVVFSPGSDSTAFINTISALGVSDTNGLVTAKLNVGANKTNRTITVTATVDSVSATNSIDVIGSAITVSGSTSLAFGASTVLTFSVKDSAGTALSNQTVTVASRTGNTIVLSPAGLTPATGITNGAGQVTATVTATKAGNDVITATAVGASTTQAITISSASFNFTTPTLAAGATTVDIPINTATPIGINWTNAGVAVAGQAVTFNTSRGTITGSPAVTNASGDTTGVTVLATNANGAGPAILGASGPGGVPAATLNVIFVATTASSASVQAVPGTVAFTTGSASQTNNSSTISVLVRDASNNLVKNAAVSFTLTADTTGGSLTSSTGTTDVSGSTSVTYVAGTTSSAANGVIITATVTSVNGVLLGAPVLGTTTLTVAGQSLLVRLGTDNLIGGKAPVNTKTYVATVTDAAGNPVVGQSVRFALRPAGYAKGKWTPGATKWNQTVFQECANEDTNFNGILEAGEDLNGSGALDPGGSATVNASGTTDSAGNATALLTYPKDHSFWTKVTLEARTGVVGNDPPTTATFYLLGLAADYADPAISPPGELSPYGVVGAAPADCFNTN